MSTPSNPRIVLHTPEPNSGAAKYVAQLAVALKRGGLPVALFCPENFVYADQLRTEGIELLTAPSRDVSDAGLLQRLARNLRYLIEALSRHHRSVRRRDIVHFQFPLRFPFGALFYLSSHLKGAATVLTAHDPMPHRWRAPRGFEWLERAWLGMEYRSCRAVIAHNRNGCAVLTGQFGLQPNRVFLIPHGPDTAAPAPAPYPPFNQLRLHAFGSIRENKGLHLAIEAVQQLIRERSMPLRLTIAGSLETVAESAYWHRCKQSIALTPHAFEVIEGFIPDEQIAPLMARHHAMILPYAAFHSESGVAALALSHARPIIATAAGGLGELLEASKAGIPILNPEKDAVIAAIASAFALGAERLEAMGTAGKRYLEGSRSWDRIAVMTAEVYRQASRPSEKLNRISIAEAATEPSAPRYAFEPARPEAAKRIDSSPGSRSPMCK